MVSMEYNPPSHSPRSDYSPPSQSPPFENSSKPKKKGETYITSAYNVLPPCSVCTEKSSGMHYGVNTCEGCKGFFRRCTQKSTPDFQCIFGDGKCMVQGASRNKCQFCRYKKCLQVGMSKGAIKIGRYTKELKIKNMEIAQQVQAVEGDVTMQRHLTNGYQNDYDAIDLTSADVVVVDRADVTKRGDVTNHDRGDVTNHTARDDVIAGSDVIELARKLLILHKETNEYSDERLPDLLCKQREYLEARSYRRIIGDHGDAKQLTGSMADHIAQRLVKPGINRVMQFAKGIPQFLSLCDEDQVTLLKPAIVEMWFLGVARTLNFDYGCYTLSDGTTIDHFSFPENINLVDCQMEVAAKVKALNFSDEELSILRAIILFSPDRPGLRHPDKVTAFQSVLIDALKLVMPHNATRTPQSVAAAMMAISDLQSLLIQYGDWILGMKVSEECSAGSAADAACAGAPPLRTRHRSAEEGAPCVVKHRRMSVEADERAAADGGATVYAGDDSRMRPADGGDESPSGDGRMVAS